MGSEMCIRDRFVWASPLRYGCFPRRGCDVSGVGSGVEVSCGSRRGCRPVDADVVVDAGSTMTLEPLRYVVEGRVSGNWSTSDMNFSWLVFRSWTTIRDVTNCPDGYRYIRFIT